MAVKYILGGLGILFLILGTARRRRIQRRTCLLVGGIFTVVSTWLFLSGS
jgi:hypothetical protein